MKFIRNSSNIKKNIYISKCICIFGDFNSVLLIPPTLVHSLIPLLLITFLSIEIETCGFQLTVMFCENFYLRWRCSALCATQNHIICINFVCEEFPVFYGPRLDHINLLAITRELFVRLNRSAYIYCVLMLSQHCL